MSASMSYFGLAYNTPTFGLDVRLVFIIPCILMPTIVLNAYLENRFGRKVMLFISLLGTGLSLLATTLIPRGVFAYNWPVIVVIYMGFWFSGGSFNFAYSYTRELFPTSLRSSTMGFASGMARVGSVLSALIATLDSINVMLPVLIYGGVSILSGLACAMVTPETKDIGLPDSLEDAENNARQPNPWFTCGRKRKQSLNLVHCNWSHA